ncbi:hypothetical protein [Ralstonia pseudosolanacearum]|uniref:non-specific lipid-transfer protein n=1 Tax=Ralstonia pseudosolanacearum TaxID=1310165 RepID=UPI003CF8E6D6
MGATCDPMVLTPCLGSISNGSPPSPKCCSVLKGQQSCFCQYARNPALGQYVNNPNTRKVLRACGVPYPRC